MTWLEDDEWERIQTLIPIAVVDIVLLSMDSPPRVGLIERETPHQGKRWNLIGGRIRYGEPLEAAVRREISDALGSNVNVRVPDVSKPHYVAQYAPLKQSGFLEDPRKHAVGLTYAVRASGIPAARREALAFAWFPITSLPARGVWGFEQDQAAELCLRAAGLSPKFSV